MSRVFLAGAFAGIVAGGCATALLIATAQSDATATVAHEAAATVRPVATVQTVTPSTLPGWHKVTQALGDALAEGGGAFDATRNWEECSVRTQDHRATVVCPDGHLTSWALDAVGDAPAWLPSRPCPEQWSTDCYWDSRGEGHSFYAITGADGQTCYLFPGHQTLDECVEN